MAASQQKTQKVGLRAYSGFRGRLPGFRIFSTDGTLSAPRPPLRQLLQVALDALEALAKREGLEAPCFELLLHFALGCSSAGSGGSSVLVFGWGGGVSNSEFTEGILKAEGKGLLCDSVPD